MMTVSMSAQLAPDSIFEGPVGVNTDNPVTMMEIKSSNSYNNLTLSRPVGNPNWSVGHRYNLNNSDGNSFPYAHLAGGISSNIAGSELGFMSFQVADGTGIWGVFYQQERMRLTNTGLGIGTSTPARSLHVNDVMRLQPRNTAPTSPAKGDIYFDSTVNKLRVYDGTTWQNCW